MKSNIRIFLFFSSRLPQLRVEPVFLHSRQIHCLNHCILKWFCDRFFVFSKWICENQDLWWHTNFCRRHVLTPHVLVSLHSWDSSDSFLLWDPLLPMVLHLHRFPIRLFHGALHLVQCRHQLEPHPCSEFLLDLRVHRSATLVSRLLKTVRTIGFCGFPFSALTNFSLHRNHETTVVSHAKNSCRPLRAISAAPHYT